MSSSRASSRHKDRLRVLNDATAAQVVAALLNGPPLDQVDRDELAGYAVHRREVRMGEASRVDFLLSHPDRPPCWLEVKNCHLRRDGTLAEFPDCVAARSSRHLRELTARVAEGARAVQLFVIQRADCDRFAACADLDPVYAAGLTAAARAGVEVLCYACDISPMEIRVARRLPWTGARRAD